ncbi:MAG: hypothetical protein ABIH37_01295 [archaeon]
MGLGNKSRRTMVNLSPSASEELGRLEELSEMSAGDIIRCSLTFFRQIVNVYDEGGKVYFEVDGKKIKVAKPY